MRYLTLGEALELHRRVIEQSGGADGVRDLGGVESAVAQPQLSFDGQELYETIEEKATALCFSLVMNHPFVDGNKRIGHAAMETFLVLNGHEVSADVDDAEQVILTPDFPCLAGSAATSDSVDGRTAYCRTAFRGRVGRRPWKAGVRGLSSARGRSVRRPCRIASTCERRLNLW